MVVCDACVAVDVLAWWQWCEEERRREQAGQNALSRGASSGDVGALSFFKYARLSEVCLFFSLHVHGSSPSSIYPIQDTVKIVHSTLISNSQVIKTEVHGDCVDSSLT